MYTVPLPTRTSGLSNRRRALGTYAGGQISGSRFVCQLDRLPTQVVVGRWGNQVPGFIGTTHQPVSGEIESFRYSMRLSAGSRLGPYEILSPIGAGGMGEVFRARDTRLQ